MKLQAVAVAAVLALIAVFAMLNWPAFTTPTPLTLVFANVNAPLGLILLVAVGVVSGLFVVYIVFQQAGVILESRRMAKELKGHRELADKAEASRFTEMRAFLEGELRRLEGQAAASGRETGARIEKLELGLRDMLAESDRSMAAHLGEIEDKLDRVLPAPRT